MTTLKFTSQPVERAAQPVRVTFCGEDMVVERPKNSVLYYTQPAVAKSVPDPDRALAILEFLQGTLSVVQFKRFMDRACDRSDPVNIGPTLDLIGGLHQRWNMTKPGECEPLVVEPGEPQLAADPITIQDEGLDLEFEAYQPKDIILLFASAGLAAGADVPFATWVTSVFLDSALEPVDSFVIAHRLKNRNDDLDVEHIAEMVRELIATWETQLGNRASRRAAVRTGKTTKTSGKRRAALPQ